MGRSWLVLVLLLSAATPAVPVGLNDTGVTFCGAYPSGNNSPCLGTEPGGQDAAYGRDVAAGAGKLARSGYGQAGFDFTKIGNDGTPLPASAVLGTAAKQWACTMDNVTGLVWELKTSDGALRDKNWTYSWYNSASPDGYSGTASGGACKQAGRCDTEKFVADVNAMGLCGHADWRMPSAKELESIVILGAAYPAIDAAYFPNSLPTQYWSGIAVPYYGPYAWSVSFADGGTHDVARNQLHAVRLVRGP